MTTTTPATRRVPAFAVVPAAIGLAWAAALVAHATGVGDRFHHGAVAGQGGAAGPAALAGFAATWTVMVAAMMLPSAVPLLRLFAEASARQSRPALVLATFVGGYLAVWGLFGGVALALDGVAHAAVASVAWLGTRPWLVGAATLALAGAVQFSAMKDRCLAQCRHPGAYLLRHYRQGACAAFRLGWGHGLFCLGCCWALMLVMFSAGATDLRWMATLGAVMAYEKVGRHGPAVAAGTGAAALVLAAAMALDGGRLYGWLVAGA